MRNDIDTDINTIHVRGVATVSASSMNRRDTSFNARVSSCPVARNVASCIACTIEDSWRSRKQRNRNGKGIGKPSPIEQRIALRTRRTYVFHTWRHVPWRFCPRLRSTEAGSYLANIDLRYVIWMMAFDEVETGEPASFETRTKPYERKKETRKRFLN